MSNCENLGGTEYTNLHVLKLCFGRLRLLSRQTKQGKESPDFNLRHRSRDATYGLFMIIRNYISLLMVINVGFWWGKTEGKRPLGRLGLKGELEGQGVG